MAIVRNGEIISEKKRKKAKKKIEEKYKIGDKIYFLSDKPNVDLYIGELKEINEEFAWVLVVNQNIKKSKDKQLLKIPADKLKKR